MSCRMESRAPRALGLVATACIAACVSASLDVEANHPASSAASFAPLPQVGHALEPSFEPRAVPTPAAGEATPTDATWTCPMHPQIIRKEPGTCPICGMKLKLVPPKAPSSGAP